MDEHPFNILRELNIQSFDRFENVDMGTKIDDEEQSKETLRYIDQSEFSGQVSSKFREDDQTLNEASNQPLCAGRIKEAHNKGPDGMESDESGARDLPRVKDMAIRVYSENERSNFDEDTGERMYDDWRYRPIYRGDLQSYRGTKPLEIPSVAKRRYSTSTDYKDASLTGRNDENGNYKRVFADMQDEYIPDFSFSDAVSKWLVDDIAMGQTEAPWSNDDEEDMRNASSSSSASLQINTSHSRVMPIPLPEGRSSLYQWDAGSQGSQPYSTGIRPTAISFEKADKIPWALETSRPSARQLKRQKSDIPPSPCTVTPLSPTSIPNLNLTSGELRTISSKLPEDFMSLPYSQRKKMIMSIFPDKDYKSVMLQLKKTSFPSAESSSRLFQSRPRRESVASQFLSSFTPSSSAKYTRRKNDIMGYKLGKILGFGAWGMVRECCRDSSLEDGDQSLGDQSTSDVNHMESGSIKAMKIVKFRENNSVKSQVLREVEIWASIKHHNILPLISWKLEEDYAIYCLTEKISGGTLYDLVMSWSEFKDSKINLKERRDISAALCLQAVCALKYMHSKSIVHGDVKLENCLLEKRRDTGKRGWHLLLCDFGMSRHFHVPAPKILDRTTDSLTKRDIHRIDKKKRKKYKIPKAVSHTGLGSLSFNEMELHERTNRDGTAPLGVSSFPKPYGPGMTSAFMLRNCLSSNELSFSSQAETIHAISADGSQDTQKRRIEVGCRRIQADPHTHIGSLPYAAPELLEPGRPYLTPSADTWALGVTLYTMLTGKLPFKHDYEPRLRAMITSAKYDEELLRSACFDDIEDGQTGQVKKSQLLMDTVVGCLQKDFKQRHSLDTVEEFLRRYLSLSSPGI
ncbi:LAMI_0G13146g1_1 [Lachancea mirantina]|uniref:LAMI_0G13146g1_1 n=1 Tax=Lachancea mirantina TaxID=1230905 RepID=A0A1G4KBP6_9SACH|nr:LAMI_0G13146g1_1 [Lachancea mirantina]